MSIRRCSTAASASVRAREAGLTDLGTLARLVAECDVVFSVINPAAALEFAREVADALRATGSHTLIVDCNAIAPNTVNEIAGVIEGAGGRLLDAGIIGPPPRGNAKANLYVSGPGAADLEQLAGPQLIVHAISDRIADASALKLCYGALNKGAQALWLEVLITARHLGVDQLLEQQLRQSQAYLYDWALGQFPILPPKAYRWAPEMLEISKTLATAGVTPRVFQRVADFIASSPARRSARKLRRIATRRGRARMSCDCWPRSAAEHDVFVRIKVPRDSEWPLLPSNPSRSWLR